MKNQKQILIDNISYSIADIEKAFDKEVKELVEEYKEDPNCWPCLWVNDTDLTGIRRASFIYNCKN